VGVSTVVGAFKLTMELAGVSAGVGSVPALNIKVGSIFTTAIHSTSSASATLVELRQRQLGYSSTSREGRDSGTSSRRLKGTIDVDRPK